MVNSHQTADSLDMGLAVWNEGATANASETPPRKSLHSPSLHFAHRLHAGGTQSLFRRRGGSALSRATSMPNIFVRSASPASQSQQKSNQSSQTTATPSSLTRPSDGWSVSSSHHGSHSSQGTASLLANSASMGCSQSTQIGTSQAGSQLVISQCRHSDVSSQSTQIGTSQAGSQSVISQCRQSDVCSQSTQFGTSQAGSQSLISQCRQSDVCCSQYSFSQGFTTPIAVSALTSQQHLDFCCDANLFESAGTLATPPTRRESDLFPSTPIRQRPIPNEAGDATQHDNMSNDTEYSFDMHKKRRLGHEGRAELETSGFGTWQTSALSVSSTLGGHFDRSRSPCSILKRRSVQHIQPEACVPLDQTCELLPELITAVDGPLLERSVAFTDPYMSLSQEAHSDILKTTDHPEFLIQDPTLDQSCSQTSTNRFDQDSQDSLHSLERATGHLNLKGATSAQPNYAMVPPLPGVPEIFKHKDDNDLAEDSGNSDFKNANDSQPRTSPTGLNPATSSSTCHDAETPTKPGYINKSSSGSEANGGIAPSVLHPIRIRREDDGNDQGERTPDSRLSNGAVLFSNPSGSRHTLQNHSPLNTTSGPDTFGRSAAEILRTPPTRPGLLSPPAAPCWERERKEIIVDLNMALESGSEHFATMTLLRSHQSECRGNQSPSNHALHEAIALQHVPALEFLLRKYRTCRGAGAIEEICGGERPLFKAVRKSVTQDDHGYKMAKLLLRYGACPNSPSRNEDHRGMVEVTPLHHAAAVGHYAMVALLIAHGANPNLADLDGYTALHVCCTESLRSLVTGDILAPRASLTILRTLLDHGADPRRKDARGRLPRELLVLREPQLAYACKMLLREERWRNRSALMLARSRVLATTLASPACAGSAGSASSAANFWLSLVPESVFRHVVAFI